MKPKVQVRRKIPEPNTPPKIWKCEDGRKVPITEMHASHIQNYINKINRRPDWRVRWLPSLESELRVRRARRIFK